MTSPTMSPPQRARTSGTVVAVVGAALVVVAAAVTGVLVLGGDQDDPPRATASTSAPTDDKNTTSPPPASSAPAEDPTRVTDQLNGITLPILTGWEKPEYFAEDATAVTTVGTYECPDGAVKYCRRGTVSSRPGPAGDGTTSEALAKEDVAKAAKAAYGEDFLGNTIRGGIRSHTVLASKPTVVAGRTGYLVRWRVVNGKGPGGYVQSVAFPSSLGSESPVILRFVFDAGTDGPALAQMDEILKGIRPIGSSTGGGVGSSVGP